MTNRSKTKVPRCVIRTIVQPAAILVLLTGAALAETHSAIMARMPHLFDASTGYRIDRQREALGIKTKRR